MKKTIRETTFHTKIRFKEAVFFNVLIKILVGIDLWAKPGFRLGTMNLVGLQRQQCLCNKILVPQNGSSCFAGFRADQIGSGKALLRKAIHVKKLTLANNPAVLPNFAISTK